MKKQSKLNWKESECIWTSRIELLLGGMRVDVLLLVACLWG